MWNVNTGARHNSKRKVWSCDIFCKKIMQGWHCLLSAFFISARSLVFMKEFILWQCSFYYRSQCSLATTTPCQVSQKWIFPLQNRKSYMHRNKRTELGVLPILDFPLILVMVIWRIFFFVFSRYLKNNIRSGIFTVHL